MHNFTLHLRSYIESKALWLAMLLSALATLTYSGVALSQAAVDQTAPNVAAKGGENSDLRVLFVSAQHSNRAKVSRLKELLLKSNEDIALALEQKSQSALGEPLEAMNVFKQYDLVILDAVSSRSSKRAYSAYMPLLAEAGLGATKILAIADPKEIHLQRGISPLQAENLHAYYSNGGHENLSRLLQYSYCQVLQAGDCQPPAAIEFPNIGIYHPNYESLIFSDLNQYLQWRGEQTQAQPIVGLMMQRAMIESMDTALIDTAIKKIEAKGALALPFYFELSPRASDYLPLLQREVNGELTTVVDAVVNFRSVHWAAKRHKEFERLGVPVLQGLGYYDGNQQDWEQDEQGISAMMTPFVLVLPETAGVIDPTIVIAQDKETEQTIVIDYQLDYLLSKAIKRAQLRRKENTDKRITVMVWGSSDVGASFLNVPDSLRAMAQRLHQEGYNIPAVEQDYFIDQVDAILSPFYRSYELDTLLSNDQAELMPVANYLKWFETLPESIRLPIMSYWGEPKDNFMVVERDGKAQFVIPRIRAGNMLVLRQPPRSDNADQEKGAYHEKTIPINHYYLAAYFYARQYWGSDALVHLGTHGSQEYLPGKERGLSRFDDGNLAVGDTPVIYPFIVDDVGEAMQTKRRGSATVLAHMTPPFAAAGLQGELADLHELMHQYKSLDEGGVRAKTAQSIVDHCLEQTLCEDMGWGEVEIAQDYEAFLEALHEYMEDLSAQSQPLGLHSFGELPREALRITTLIQMLGADFLPLAAQYERDQYPELAHAEQLGKEELGTIYNHLADSTDEDSLEQLVGFKLIRDWVVQPNEKAVGLYAQDDKSAYEAYLAKELDEPLAKKILQAQQWYGKFVGIKEMDNLVAALAGAFTPVKNGGDPIRHPDSLPTGFNLIGFDPSRVPTPAAYEQGVELTDQLIAEYYQKHGRYPDKLAFSLWSIETMRHYGVLEAQVLHAMGVKPKWSPDGRVIGTEIIPAAELKRPRVDVVLSATGLYRDAFPNVMQRLAKAIEELAKLKEEGNSIWRNSQRIAKDLKAEGVAPEEAEYLSSVRIFSNESGSYGSGVNTAVFESDSWEADGEISDVYLSKMGYYFGSDDSRWGKSSEGLYAKQLSGTDVALFSRSSNVFGMLSSDDPFEYYGALSLAVRNIDGKSPEMMISNLRDASNPKAEAASKFLAKELRTRQFHKRWIQEMQREGYSGAVTLSSQLANFWGWQVVDPSLVRDDQWQEFYEVYVEDKHELDLNEWFESVNPRSQAQMLEWMLEANRKDYWKADADTLKAMIERYDELLNRHDLLVKNEAMREFLDQQAQGFGLNINLPAPEVPASAAAQQQAQNVEGQKLEEVQSNNEEWTWDWSLIGTLCLSLILFLMGGVMQHLRGGRSRAALGLD